MPKHSEKWIKKKSQLIKDLKLLMQKDQTTQTAQSNVCKNFSTPSYLFKYNFDDLDVLLPSSDKYTKPKMSQKKEYLELCNKMEQDIEKNIELQKSLCMVINFLVSPKSNDDGHKKTLLNQIFITNKGYRNRRCDKEISKEYNCPYLDCNRKYVCNSSLKLHIKNTHDFSDPLKASGKDTHCRILGKKSKHHLHIDIEKLITNRFTTREDNDNGDSNGEKKCENSQQDISCKDYDLLKSKDRLSQPAQKDLQLQEADQLLQNSDCKNSRKKIYKKVNKTNDLLKSKLKVIQFNFNKMHKKKQQKMIAEKGTISKSEMEIVKKSDADINTNTIAIIPTTDITINGSVFDYNWLDNKDTSKHQNNNTFDALLSDCGLTNYSALEVNDFDELLLKHASCNYICKDDCLYSKDFVNLYIYFQKLSIDSTNFFFSKL